MGQRIEYVVACHFCEQWTPVALIDDTRSIGGTLTIRGPGPDDTLRQFAVAEGDRHSDLYRNATASWANYNVIEAEWGDGHSTWIIRCRACTKQAQLRDEKMSDIADNLASAIDQLPLPENMPTRHEFPLSWLIRFESR